jgi:hypothetical protein
MTFKDVVLLDRHRTPVIFFHDALRHGQVSRLRLTLLARLRKKSLLSSSMKWSGSHSLSSFA